MALQYSQRLPETAFYTKKSKGFFKILHSTQVPIQNSKSRTPYSRRQRALWSRIQFYMQKAKRSSSTSIPATRPSKGIPDIPDIPDIPVIHDIQPSRHFYTFQCIQGSTPLQHSPIRMHILHFDWFPQKLHRVPVETLHYYKLSFFKEREMLRYGSCQRCQRCWRYCGYAKGP